MYSFRSRVRYSEVNSEKELMLPALMDYMQDCCTFQSEDMGIGVDYLEANRFAWVLSSWEIVISGYPKFGEQIEVSTWPYDFKGFYGYRNFMVKDGTGKVKAFANSVWVFMDTNSMKPVKIADAMADAYLPEISPVIEYQWSERKIRILGEGERKEPVRVQKFHIDTNHHMNNGKYVLAAEEYLPDHFSVRKIRAEYKRAAMLGDWLYPFVFSDEDSMTVALADEDKRPYAVVRFMRSRE